MSRGDGFAFLGELNGRQVGFAAYHHTTRHDTDTELESIFVLREVQRRGLGTELLRVMEAGCAKRDREACALDMIRGTRTRGSI
jgi:GNAT superfamily N-acetyltransferase